jgi:hypothetical protein
MRVALDSVACSRSRAKATFSEHLKESLKDKSLIDPADRMDSDTIRSLYRRVSNKLLASSRLLKKIN